MATLGTASNQQQFVEQNAMVAQQQQSLMINPGQTIVTPTSTMKVKYSEGHLTSVKGYDLVNL